MKWTVTPHFLLASFASSSKKKKIGGGYRSSIKVKNFFRVGFDQESLSFLLIFLSISLTRTDTCSWSAHCLFNYKTGQAAVMLLFLSRKTGTTSPFFREQPLYPIVRKFLELSESFNQHLKNSFLIPQSGFLKEETS